MGIGWRRRRMRRVLSLPTGDAAARQERAFSYWETRPIEHQG